MVVSCSLFELLAFFLSIPFACRLVPLLILCMALSGFTLCLCSCCPSLPSVSRCCGSSGRGVSSSCRLPFLSGCPGWHKPALPRTAVLFPSVHRCCRVHDAPSVCLIRDMRPVYCVVVYQHWSYSLNYVSGGFRKTFLKILVHEHHSPFISYSSYITPIFVIYG